MRKLYFLAIVLCLVSASCRFMGKRVRGNGTQASIEKTVSSFDEVEANGSIKLMVSQGELKPVRIESDENILSYIEVIQEGSKIIIQPKKNVNLDPTQELNVYVSSPHYKSIEVSGSSDIVGQNKISSTEELNLGASGAGDIQMEVDAPKVTAGISGSGSITLKGQTKTADIDLSGAGHAYCFDLLSENTSVEISGAGSAQVYASVKLDAQVSGAGNVHYKGNPTISQDISGAGSIEKSE